MKKINTLLLSSLSCLAAFGSAINANANPSQDALNYDKINSSIASALRDFSATSNGIDLSYQIDPSGTDIDADRYLFNVQLKLARTPWASNLNDQTQQSVQEHLRGLDASGTFGIQTDLADRSSNATTLSISATYKTDVLAMLKYKVANISHCDMVDKGAGITAIIWRRNCEYAQRLDAIDSVPALYQLLTEEIAVHKADVAAYLDDLQQGINQINLQSQQGSDIAEVVDVLKAQQTQAERLRDFFDGVTLQETANGFTIQTQELDGCMLFLLKGLRLDVSPEVLTVDGTVQLNFGKSLYAAAKPVALEVLRGLERGDDYALRMVKLDAEVFANMINNAMNETQGSQEQVSQWQLAN